tara:strand:- start:1142 stop:1924 length:783 start_codon:yes stop_codon:yes gene_type:complete
MKIKTIVLGKRSFLTKSLVKEIKGIKVISSNEINKFNEKKLKIKKFNIIINLFHPTYKKIIDNKKFKKLSKDLVFQFLKKIESRNIRKIIYTSSAIAFFKIKNSTATRFQYLKMKKIMEKKLTLYCKKNNIKLIIARPFNMYGGKDKGSIIYKIKNYNKIKSKLLIFNNGKSVRDFIHVKDVAKVYKVLLSKKYSGVLGIGTGKGTSVIELIKKANILNYVTFSNNNNFELSKTNCNTKKLSNIVNITKFKKVENFLKIK